MKRQQEHSKGKEIHYRDLSLQSYLKSYSPLSTDEKRFLFAARTRGLSLGNNFKQGRQDIQCRLCKDHIEDQQSLLSCSALKHIKSPSQPKYSDIFSGNLDKLAAITNLLKMKFADFTTQVNRQQSSSATNVIDVDNNVNDIVELD